jgi:hypothetical protein
MKYKLLALGVIGIASASILGFLASDASAYRGDYTQVGPNHTEERHAQMQEVMETKDYETWKEMMTEDGRTPGVLRKIDTQEKFEAFVQAREMALEGDTEGANEIRESLGMGQGQGNGGMRGNGNCNR